MKQYIPLLIVAFACVVGAYGFHRRDLSPLEALALVGSAVTVGAGVHAHARHKAKKKHHSKSSENGRVA